MNLVTRAEVEVQPYAFTTRSIYVGHLDHDYLRWQVIDTPGILDRPLDEMNKIEHQVCRAPLIIIYNSFSHIFNIACCVIVSPATPFFFNFLFHNPIKFPISNGMWYTKWNEGYRAWGVLESVLSNR